MIPQPSHPSARAAALSTPTKRPSTPTTHPDKASVSASLKDGTLASNGQQSNEGPSDCSAKSSPRVPAAADESCADLHKAINSHSTCIPTSEHQPPTPSQKLNTLPTRKASSENALGFSPSAISQSQSCDSPVVSQSTSGEKVTPQVVAHTVQVARKSATGERLARKGAKDGYLAESSEGGVLLQNVSSLTKALGDLQGSLTRNVVPFARNLLGASATTASQPAASAPASSASASAGTSQSPQVRFINATDPSSESSVELPHLQVGDQPNSLSDYVMLNPGDPSEPYPKHAHTSSPASPAQQRQQQSTNSSTSATDASRASPPLPSFHSRHPPGPPPPITPLVDLSLVPEHILNDDEGFPLFLFNGVCA